MVSELVVGSGEQDIDVLRQSNPILFQVSFPKWSLNQMTQSCECAESKILSRCHIHLIVDSVDEYLCLISVRAFLETLLAMGHTL